MFTEDDRQQLRTMGFRSWDQSRHPSYEGWSRDCRGDRSHVLAYGAPTHDFIVYPHNTFNAHSVRIVTKTFPEAIAAYVAALLRGDT